MESTEGPATEDSGKAAVYPDDASRAASPSDVEQVQRLRDAYQHLKSELGKIIVGQEAF